MPQKSFSTCRELAFRRNTTSLLDASLPAKLAQDTLRIEFDVTLIAGGVHHGSSDSEG